MIGHQLFKLGARLGKGQRLNVRQYIPYYHRQSARRAHIPTCMGVESSSSRHILALGDVNCCAAGTAIAAYFGDVLHAHT